MGAGELPVLSGAAWQATFDLWVQRMRNVKVVDFEKAPVVVGVRRVHPSNRTPPLHGWDTMHLLALFKVSVIAIGFR